MLRGRDVRHNRQMQVLRLNLRKQAKRNLRVPRKYRRLQAKHEGVQANRPSPRLQQRQGPTKGRPATPRNEDGRRPGPQVQNPRPRQRKQPRHGSRPRPYRRRNNTQATSQRDRPSQHKTRQALLPNNRPPLPQPTRPQRTSRRTRTKERLMQEWQYELQRGPTLRFGPVPCTRPSYRLCGEGR